MKLPGAFWVALMTAIIGLLQGDWFAGELWVPAAVIALGAVAKILEIYLVDRKAAGDYQAAFLVENQSKASRFLFG